MPGSAECTGIDAIERTNGDAARGEDHRAARGIGHDVAQGISRLGLRVLVVDDDRQSLAHASALLGDRGITPTLARDGAQAVALACERGFDLILMDLQMPVLDGLTATRQIRVHETERAHPRAPVVAYTSCRVEAQLLRECGVDGVLEKPCAAEALQECLLRWCATSGAQRTGADAPALADALR